MINPVLRKEIKTSMRSWKIFLAIGLYLLLMFGAVFMFIYFTQLSITTYSFNFEDASVFYILMSLLQLGFIMFISPALTSGSISGEREKQTLDMMLLTKMNPISIIIGKLLSSLGIVIIMIITSFPVFSIVLNYCGISIINLLTIFGFFILISCSMGSIGIFFSTIFKKTSIATVASYIFIFVICILNLIAYVINKSFPYYFGGSQNYQNSLLSDLVDTLFLATNPFIGFSKTITLQMGMGDMFAMNSNIESFIGIINIVFNILVTLIFITLSAKNISLSKSKASKKGK